MLHCRVLLVGVTTTMRLEDEGARDDRDSFVVTRLQ